jgi:uncharacterized protein YndB with AHSA1/START domain
MSTRSQWHEIELPVSPAALFNLLLAPKAIRGRWNNIAAVVTEVDGAWVIAWGQRENDPDYVSGARIKSFQAPQRVTLAFDYSRARSGLLSFANGMAVELTIQAKGASSLLRVTHTGLPAADDDYFNACADGWRAALQGLGAMLMPPPSQQSATRR